MYDSHAGFDIVPNFDPRPDYSAEEPYLIWSNELGCFDRPYVAGIPYILLASYELCDEGEARDTYGYP